MKVPISKEWYAAAKWRSPKRVGVYTSWVYGSPTGSEWSDRSMSCFVQNGAEGYAFIKAFQEAECWTPQLENMKEKLKGIGNEMGPARELDMIP